MRRFWADGVAALESYEPPSILLPFRMTAGVAYHDLQYLLPSCVRTYLITRVDEICSTIPKYGIIHDDCAKSERR